MMNRDASKKGVVIDFWENRQFPTDGGIQDLAAGPGVSLVSHPVSPLGSLQVRQLPAEALTEVAGVEVVRVVPLRDDRGIGPSFRLETVIDPDQDDLLQP